MEFVLYFAEKSRKEREFAMNTREMQDEIMRLKREKNICILAHAYQSHDIWEVADYVGDSYGLSVKAAGHSSDVRCPIYGGNL